MEKHKAKAKKVNQTFSIPVEISNELHIYVKQREMSQFVSDAIRKEREAKKNQLRQEFADIKNDPIQREVLREWDSTLGDGIEDVEW